MFARLLARTGLRGTALASGLLAVALAGGALSAPAPSVRPATSPTGASDVDHIINLILHHNPTLRSYEAHVVLDIRQLDFPYLHPVLNGRVYYTAPGYTVYDFSHVPSYLRGITRVEGAMGMASRWRECYAITAEEQPDAYVLHMVPKIPGEIERLDVVVNRRTGALQHFSWTYVDSPVDNISLTQYYSIVNGYDVVTLQQSDITRHHIRAKATGTFDSFVYNVPVPTPTPTPSDPLHHCDN
jgi:hypothetical protein